MLAVRLVYSAPWCYQPNQISLRAPFLERFFRRGEKDGLIRAFWNIAFREPVSPTGGWTKHVISRATLPAPEARPVSAIVF